MPRSAPWFLPNTTDPVGTIVVTLRREPAPRTQQAAWIASCAFGNREYHARSGCGSVVNLCQHLARIGTPDAPLLIRVPGQPDSKHASFYQLAGAAPAGRTNHAGR